MHRKGDKLKLISSNEEIKEKKEKNGEFLCKVNPFNDYYGIDLNNTNRSTPYDIDNIPWLDLQRPTTNYMIIEGIVKENLETKSIFIIKLLEHTQIKIGRASDADVRLNDISVSRCHAIIRLCDGFCVLSDTKSKYGTLVNTGNKLCVLPKKPLTIVKENTMLKFRMDMKLCCLLSCYRPKNIPYKNYNIFFERVGNTKCRIKDNPSLLWSETQIVSEYEGKKSIIKKLDKTKCIDNSQIAEEDKIDIPVSSQENYKCK